MTELKTLKDIVAHGNIAKWLKEEIKAEAIKWVKKWIKENNDLLKTIFPREILLRQRSILDGKILATIELNNITEDDLNGKINN